MKAVIRRGNQLVTDTIADLTPAQGQVIVKTLKCGICGSDLHALDHMGKLCELATRSGGDMATDPDKDIVFGHEFCAEIVDYGPDTSKTHKIGTKICSMPIALGANGVEAIGYSNNLPGGFGEYMALMADMIIPVPEGTLIDHAALTEPFAVGEHAVIEAALTGDEAAIVIGCGPIGLSVIAALKLRGMGPVVAADFSAERRKLAEDMGADIVLDPAQTSPYSKWSELGVPTKGAERMMMDMMGRQYKEGVIFECVGVPGVIQQIMEGAPPHSKIIVVGVCMELDKIEPAMAINKQLELKFVLGYTPDEFSQTLRNISDGKYRLEGVISDTVGLEGVADAFKALQNDPKNIKILVDPSR